MTSLGFPTLRIDSCRHSDDRGCHKHDNEGDLYEAGHGDEQRDRNSSQDVPNGESKRASLAQPSGAVGGGGFASPPRGTSEEVRGIQDDDPDRDQNRSADTATICCSFDARSRYRGAAGGKDQTKETDDS